MDFGVAFDRPETLKHSEWSMFYNTAPISAAGRM